MILLFELFGYVIFFYFIVYFIMFNVNISIGFLVFVDIFYILIIYLIFSNLGVIVYLCI